MAAEKNGGCSPGHHLKGCLLKYVVIFQAAYRTFTKINICYYMLDMSRIVSSFLNDKANMTFQTQRADMLVESRLLFGQPS